MPLNEMRTLTPLDQVPPPLDNQSMIPDDFKTQQYNDAKSEINAIYDAKNKPVLLASRERLNRLGESMERTIISPENERDVRTKIDEILK